MPTLPKKKKKTDTAEQIAQDSTTRGFDPIWITDKIMQFGEALTGITLYQYQRDTAWRIIYSVVANEGEVLTMLFARQSGKTEALAFAGATLTVILPALANFIPELQDFKNGFAIGLFAPQSEQVTTTHDRTLNRLSTENAALIMEDPEIDTELEYETRLVLSNGSYMLGQTASIRSKIESKTYHLIFVEEAQDVDSYLLEKSIEPMLASTNGTMVKCGTTGTQKNHYFYDIQANAKRNRQIKDPRLKVHFEFDYKEIIRQKADAHKIDGNPFHLKYEQYVLKQIKIRGYESEAFKLNYRLVWPLDTGMFITDRQWISILNKKASYIRPYRIEDDWDMRAGLDIAKKGGARTVLTIGRTIPAEPYKPPKKEVLYLTSYWDISYDLQHDLIMQALVDYNIRVLYADSTGVGEAVVDRLIGACGDYVLIVPYTFTRPSKSKMWLSLSEDISNGRLKIPANKQVRAGEEYKLLEDQMKSLVKYYEGGHLVAEKPDDDHFDDFPDSLGLFSLACEEVFLEQSEVTILDANPFYPAASSIHQTLIQNSWMPHHAATNK